MKPWYKSKAIWLSAFQFLGAAIPIYLGTSTNVIGADTALRLSATFTGVSALGQAAIRAFWTEDKIG